MKNELRVVGLAIAVLAWADVARAAPPRFVMIPKSSSQYYRPCFDGFEAAAAKYGIQVQRVDPAKPDAAIQASLIADAVAGHADGIAVSAIDDAGVTPAIEAATRAGVPVITFDSPAPSSSALAYIGTDNHAAGVEAGRRFGAALRGGGAVLVLQGGMGAANLNQRAAGFREGLGRAAPSARIVEVVDVSGDAAAVPDRVETALRTHPDVKAVFSVSSAGAPAAAAIVDRQGRSGKILVAGFDDLPATLQGIDHGTISFCVVQKTFKMGWLSLRALTLAGSGKKLPKVVDTGVVFVTRANLATYVDEMRSEVTRKASP